MSDLPTRQADRLYHDLLSPEETRTVRADARTIVERHVQPRAAQIASGDEVDTGFPRDVFDSLAQAGLFRLPFPDDVGGAGLLHRASATAAVVEELAYFSNSVAAIFDVHCILAGNALNAGSQQQRQRWLPPLVDGKIVGAFATSEPGASSDLSPAAVQTEATRTADGWTLTGRKRWITNSPAADVVVVLARTGDSLSLFITPTHSPGLAVGRADRKLGNRGQLTADVILDDVRLDHDALLGREGEAYGSRCRR